MEELTEEMREVTQADIDQASKWNWDLEFDNKPWQVYRLAAKHRLGGRWENLYCCPYGEKLTLDNIIAFCGEHAPKWEIRWVPHHKYRDKWGSSSIESGGSWKIYRNDKLFLSGGARDMGYGLAKAQSFLVESIFEGHVAAFHERDWKKDLIDRKIWYKNQEAVIKRVHQGGGDITCTIVREDGKDFVFPSYEDWHDDDEDSKEIRACIFSDSIGWFRETQPHN